jgi:hypothetical protein
MLRTYFVGSEQRIKVVVDAEKIRIYEVGANLTEPKQIGSWKYLSIFSYKEGTILARLHPAHSSYTYLYVRDWIYTFNTFAEIVSYGWRGWARCGNRTYLLDEGVWVFTKRLSSENPYDHYYNRNGEYLPLIAHVCNGKVYFDIRKSPSFAAINNLENDKETIIKRSKKLNIPIKIYTL